MKRKRMIKQLMSYGVPRNKAEFYANMCGGEMPHRVMTAYAVCRPDICEMMWWLWVRVRRTCILPKARLVRGQT